MGWDACTQDPNWLFRQIECHPSTAGWVQAIFALLVIIAAFAVPALGEFRAQTRRNKTAYASAAIAMQAWRDTTVVELLRVDNWDSAREPVPQLRLPELAVRLDPERVAAMPRDLGATMLNFENIRGSILAEAEQTTFEEDAINAQPSYLRRSAELALYVDEMHQSFAKKGNWIATPMQDKYRERLQQIIKTNSRREFIQTLPI